MKFDLYFMRECKDEIRKKRRIKDKLIKTIHAFLFVLLGVGVAWIFWGYFTG